MILFLLKAIAFSAFFSAYYVLFLRDKQMFQYNRFYLLSAMTASVLLPFATESLSILPTFLTARETSSSTVLKTYSKLNNFHVESEQLGKWLLLLSGLLTLGLLVKFCRELYAIHMMKRNNPVIKKDGYNLVETNAKSAPFTFFNNLFWRTDISLTDDLGHRIFSHELAHIKGKHTWDRIVSIVIVSILWMNPFIWFLQKELFTIHEYIADDKAIDKGNTTLFAKMLLKTFHIQKVSGAQQFFFNSSIKRRLTMITNEKNTSWKPIRKFLVVPVTILFVCVMIFVCGNSQNRTGSFNKNSAVNSIKNKRDTVTYDSAYVDVVSLNHNGKSTTVKQRVFYTKNNEMATPQEKITSNDHRSTENLQAVDAKINYTKENGSIGVVTSAVKYSTSQHKKN